MDRRIRIVYIVSIATMALVLVVQAYWLHCQYQLSATQVAASMEPVLDKLVAEEQDARYNQALLKRKAESKMDTLRVKINVKIDRRNKKGRTRSHTLVEYTMPGGTKRKITADDLSTQDANDIYDRFEASRYEPFSRHIIDSLLVGKGYSSTRSFSRLKRMPIGMKPHYTLVGEWRKSLHVEYCSNPMEHEGVEFTVGVPTVNVIQLMAWQLVAGLLLVVVIACCLSYQTKTIVVQKRIDGIRRELWKNMVLEQKQPKDDGGEDAVVVGDTEFRYGLNQLSHGNERVMLTSRQTEIFRLLAERPNETVNRERILQEAWGDDSYANSLALNVQISYLRRAIKGDPRLSIEVIYKKGYVLRVMQ